MILRRLTEHIRTQNWFAVGLDLLIVVVGVFIGIQVSNWNEERVARERLSEQLVSLHAEFSENLERFEVYRSSLDGQLDDIAALRMTIADPRSGLESNDIDRGLMNVSSVAIFTVDRTTVDELTQDGGLRQLSAFGLREPLIAWQEAHDRVKRLERDAIEYRDKILIPYIVDELAFGAMGRHYAFTADLLDDAPFSNTPDMLQGNRKLDNALVLRLGTTAACRQLVSELMERTEATIRQLETEGYVS